MTYSSPSISPDAKISQAKMDKIIEAVIDGKYSYACLVVLEEAGYDPAHYIPYRTYNRLQKQHQAGYQSTQKTTAKMASQMTSQVASQMTSQVASQMTSKVASKVASIEPKIERAKIAAQKIAAPTIADIDYVEAIQGQEKLVKGGYGAQQSERVAGPRKMPFWQAGLRLCGYST